MDETCEAWKARIGVGQPCHAFRRVGGPGTTRSTPVARDTDGTRAGTRTEHWSGRVDATVTNPRTTYLIPTKEPSDA